MVRQPLVFFVLTLWASTAMAKGPDYGEFNSGPDKGDFRCNCGKNIDNNAQPDFHRETALQICADCNQAHCNSTQFWITFDPQGPTFKGDRILGEQLNHLYRGADGSALKMAHQELLPPRYPLTLTKLEYVNSLGPGYAAKLDHNPGDPWANIAAHLVNDYLAPHEINIRKRDPWLLVFNATDCFPEFQANYNAFPGDKGVCTIFVKEKSMMTNSIPAITSKLGHELVHVLQYRRVYSQPAEALEKLEEIIQTVDELEARSWQKGVYNPGRASVWPPPFEHMGAELYPQQTDKERKEIDRGMDCNEYLLKKQIAELRNEYKTLVVHTIWDDFVAWVGENPWMQATWVPAHPKWKEFDLDEIENDPKKPEHCVDVTSKCTDT